MVRRRKDVEDARAEHDEYIDPSKPTRENDLIVLSRAEDRSFWWMASYYAQKYIILWAPLLWLVTSIGFGVITPANKAQELKARVDAAAELLQRQIDSIRVWQTRIIEKQEGNARSLNVLVRQACIDRRVTQYDKQLIGLVDSQGNCIR